MRSFALAGLLAVTVMLEARGFVIIRYGSGHPLRWDLLTTPVSVSTNVVNRTTHAVRYFLGSDAYSATNTAAELNAVRAAFGQWQAVSDSHLKFEDAGLVVPPMDVDLNDHRNLIFWAKNSTFVNGGMDNISGALGVTFSSSTDPDTVFVEADIAFNGVEYNWFTDYFDPSNSSIFVESVAMHEIGHFIGLKHVPIGGGAMFHRAPPGLSLQAGLSADDISAARYLYPVTPANYGAVKGTITKGGSPILGAAVFARNAAGNTVAGTVTASNGTYQISALPSGNYQIRVAPLDDASASDSLCRGYDVGMDYAAADTTFLPTTNKSLTVVANATNTADFSVTAGTPTFRITRVRTPSAVAGAYSSGRTPVALRAGQSNFFVTVFSADLPTNGAIFTITGDGLTMGTPTYQPGNIFAGLNGITMSLSVASNATPGMRDFIVQQGADTAYASGFFEVLATITDDNFDGLDDSFQRQYFPLFTAANAAPAADPDGDLMNNYAESIAGTVPTNAASVLKLLSVARTGNTATLRWISGNGKKYQLAYRANLATGGWSNLGSIVIGAGTNTQFADTTATNAFRFYRVQALP